MQDVPQVEDWERTELSEEEEGFASQLAGLIEVSTMAQYNMFDFFESIEPAIRSAVYHRAMEIASTRIEGQTNPAPKVMQ